MGIACDISDEAAVRARTAHEMNAGELLAAAELPVFYPPAIAAYLLFGVDLGLALLATGALACGGDGGGEGEADQAATVRSAPAPAAGSRP